MESYFRSAVSKFLDFYSNLNQLGLILFYCFISLIVILIILIGVIERNKSLNNSKKKVSNILPNVPGGILPVITSNNKPEIKNTVQPVNKNQDIEIISEEDSDQFKDIVEDVANRNIVNISSITKQMEEDIENNKNIKLTDFEEDQEAKSIISYDELLEKTTKLKAEDIVNSLSNQTNNNQFIANDKKFTNTPIISPVYGVNDIKKKEQAFQEQIYKERTIDVSNNKNNDFLKALKDLKRKLD